MEIKQINEWNIDLSSIQNKLQKRLLEVFVPILQINDTVYVDYIGDKDKKIAALTAMKENKDSLQKILDLKISSKNALDQEKLKWVLNLVKLKDPSEITIKVFK